MIPPVPKPGPSSGRPTLPSWAMPWAPLWPLLPALLAVLVYLPALSGGFVYDVFVPLFAPGIQTISASVGDVTASSAFTVAPEARETPPVLDLTSTVEKSPDPEEPQTINAALAMESLTQAGNLVRVWNYDNQTKTWAFFDPRPAFADASSIMNMVAGRVYWVRVINDQTAVLNGNSVNLFAGWNLMPW